MFIILNVWLILSLYNGVVSTTKVMENRITKRHESVFEVLIPACTWRD
jgi:hypothetical protein